MTELAYFTPAAFAAAWGDGATSAPGRAALFAELARVNTLSMVMQAGSGHLGSSFSSLDIVSWLYLAELGAYEVPTGSPLRGVYFSSKGHDAPGLYAVLTGLERLQPSLVHALRRLGGLPGHPDVATPGMEANTGSLGMGISKAKGIIEAHRLDGRTDAVYVLTGDGELQEGQNWEALQGAVNRGLAELTVIVDHNKIQSDTWVRRVSDLGDIEAKFAAFGCAVVRCDGHDLEAVRDALDELSSDTGRPGVLVADTVKGRGVSFMETFPEDGELYPFHSGAPDPDTYAAALAELLASVSARADALGISLPELLTVTVGERRPAAGTKLVDAWSQALVARASRDDRIVALDGDLVLDTGLIPFSKAFPERFIECGIAEQDMVGQAGGLALRGKVPVVHSFASFLSGRPHEQVLVNSTERRKILYVGSLAGIVPGGPGHSHQAVTDVASFAMVHGLLAVEPADAGELSKLLDLLIDVHPGAGYIRLSTPPIELPFDWPDGAEPRIGRGTMVRHGSDVTIAVAGRVLLREVWLAAEELAARGVAATVISMPWLNTLDVEWWRETLEPTTALVTVENHVAQGGMGQYLMSQTQLLGWRGRSLQLAVNGIPVCGTNDEVLAAHGLDHVSITRSIEAFLSESRA